MYDAAHRKFLYYKAIGPSLARLRLMQQNESPSGATRGDAVTFTAPDGTWWRVYEAEGGAVPGSRGARCLCFDSAWVIRRVWNYPENWRDLSAKDLEALSWQR